MQYSSVPQLDGGPELPPESPGGECTPAMFSPANTPPASPKMTYTCPARVCAGVGDPASTPTSMSWIESPLKSPPPATETPAPSFALWPLNLSASYAVPENAVISGTATRSLPSGRPYTTYAAPALLARASLPIAPRITSIHPSSFRSECPPTAYPAQSPAFSPRIANPVEPSPEARSPTCSVTANPPPSRPYTTYTSPPVATEPAAALYAPTTKSSTPSPFTSPAPLTANPQCPARSYPARMKPTVPSKSPGTVTQPAMRGSCASVASKLRTPRRRAGDICEWSIFSVSLGKSDTGLTPSGSKPPSKSNPASSPSNESSLLHPLPLHLTGGAGAGHA
mmetsp:Transcript_64739/g.134977  ORF Transcript_64739/g.134977 Transcript_64739/m.134977 type:complete len:338 (+) Transcript_64739:756-1769(+)